MGPHRSTRRRVLGLAVLAAAGALAGCRDGGGDGTGDTDGTGGGDDGGGGYGGGNDDSGTDGSDDTDESGGTDDAAGGSDGATAAGETPTGTPETDELDLREANVVGVEFEGGNGSYGFDVTLHHDDDGEDGYANWWQVERLDGTQLGRRELLHPHSRQPFTRSETIDVPAGVTCVVVRGHDQTHGYGGRAVLVNLETGAQRSVVQGSEPQSFDEGGCP